MNDKPRLPRVLAGALLASLACATPPASARGGPVPIDQAKAEAGGVSPGDGAGFPVTLSEPGLYRLMGNLTVNDVARTAILITSAGVTLDLNGFEVRGPNACSGGGAQLDCTSMSLPGNAVRGHAVNVAIGNEGPASVVVTNGSLRGFAGHGLVASGVFYNFTARGLNVSHMGQSGVRFAGAVVDSTVDHNVGGGIDASTGVMHNRLMFNRAAGLTASLARWNASWNNGQADSANATFE